MKTSSVSKHGKPMHDSPVLTMSTLHIYHVSIKSCLLSSYVPLPFSKCGCLLGNGRVRWLLPCGRSPLSTQCGTTRWMTNKCVCRVILPATCPQSQGPSFSFAIKFQGYFGCMVKHFYLILLCRLSNISNQVIIKFTHSINILSSYPKEL